MVRRATAADAGRIAEINIAAWRTAYRGLVSGEFLDGMRHDVYRRRWEDGLAGQVPSAAMFLAVGEDEEIRAYAYVSEARAVADRHPSPTGELCAIYADPDWRGTGAGSAVHDAGLAHLTAEGFRRAILWVLVDNTPSRRYYARRGWRCDGITQTVGLEDLVEVRYSRQLSSV